MKADFLHYLRLFKNSSKLPLNYETKPFLFVGLGNPGERYKGTRHNIGFEVINLLARKYEKKFKKKYKSRIFDISYLGRKLFFQKPMTYMNSSGIVVKHLCSAKKIANSQVVVIYDDVNLPLGEIRVRKKGSAGGHNGIKSIITELNGDDFIRVRLGINTLPVDKKLEDFVLESFSQQEEPLVKEVCKKAVEAVLMLYDKDCEAVMNFFNGKICKQPSQEIKNDKI